jgi:hypothetical protein
MRFQYLGVAAAASCLAALIPASVTLAKPASPIIVDYCHIDYEQGPNVTPSAAIALTKKSGPLEIKFTNESEKTATTIRFGVEMEKSTASIRDVGSFAPGITIHHKFRDFSGQTKFIFSSEPQPKCSVQYVKFADGSTWSAGEE